MTTDKPFRNILVPLTCCDRHTGAPYLRPPEVAEEIEATLSLPLHDAFALACSGRLRPQTLVYFVRNIRPNRRNKAYEDLVVAFYSRLERSGDKLVSGLTETQREWVQGEVVVKATEWLHDDRMDIFECSFKTGAERLFLTAIAKVRRRTRGEVAREDLSVSEGDLTGEEAADALSVRHTGFSRPLAEVRAELSEIMDKLTVNERLAVVYLEQMGMTEKEAAERIGCSDRNVRYLIKRVQAKASGEPKRARSRALESGER